MANTVSGKYRNDTGPLTTSYTSFDAYHLEDSIIDELMDKDVFVMMVEGQKQTISKGSNIISEKYLAGGEGFSMGGEYGDGEVLVVIQSSDGTDVVAYVVKTREEIGDEHWMEYRHAFMGGMTDEIWNTMRGWFSSEIHTTINGGYAYVNYNDGDNIIVDLSVHSMRAEGPFDYYNTVDAVDCTSEYNVLSSNGWLTEGTHEVESGTLFNNTLASLKTKGNDTFSIYHDTSLQEVHIKNGNRVVLAMQDKNLGALSYDITSSDSYGDSYCWGATTSPGVAETEDWELIQTIAPVGYHIPSIDECSDLIDLYKTFNNSVSSFYSELLLPLEDNGTYGDIWTSSRKTLGSDSGVGCLSYSSSFVEIPGSPYNPAVPHKVRCFKNTVNANMNPGFDEEDI